MQERERYDYWVLMDAAQARERLITAEPFEVASGEMWDIDTRDAVEGGEYVVVRVEGFWPKPAPIDAATNRELTRCRIVETFPLFASRNVPTA